MGRGDIVFALLGFVLAAEGTFWVQPDQSSRDVSVQGGGEETSLIGSSRMQPVLPPAALKLCLGGAVYPLPALQGRKEGRKEATGVGGPLSAQSLAHGHQP